MNDEQLTKLLRMAAEADLLAGDESRLPAASLGHRESIVRRGGVGSRARWGLAMGAAAAVLAAGAFVAVRANGPTRASGLASWPRGEVATVARGLTPTGAGRERKALGGPTGNMMLAVFSDECGQRACVVTHDRDALSGRDPTKMSDEELIRLALDERCDSVADHVTVIGLSGPDASLPRTDREAEVLAACVGMAPVFGQPGGSMLACVPPGVSVVTASLSLGSR